MCHSCGCRDTETDHGKGHMGVDPEGKAITTKSEFDKVKEKQLSVL